MDAEEKKYILSNFNKKTPKEIADALGMKERKVRKFIESIDVKKISAERSSVSPRGPKKWPVFVMIIVLAVMAFGVYVPVINGEFLLDDDLLIVDNIYVKSLANTPRIFGEDMGSGIGLQSSYYRPLQMLSYAIEYKFFKLNNKVYHLTNNIIQVFVVICVFFLILIVFKDRMLAFFTALLYLAHPAHAESVAYISGRGDCLVALFTLLTMIFYVRASERGGFLNWLTMFVVYVIALFSKENSLIVPGLIVMYHFTLRRKFNIFLIFLVGLTTFIYMFFRVSFFKMYASEMTIQAALQRLPGIFDAMAGYIKILIWPFDLNMGHETRPFTFTEPMVIVGYFVVLGLITSFFLILKKKKAAFGLGWYLVALVPVLNLFPVAFYMADHYLYIPSIGLFLILAELIRRLYIRNRTGAIVATMILIFIVGGLSALTLKQNYYWMNPKSFYERTLIFAPKSPRNYSNLARVYLKEGNIPKGLELYKKAIEIDPGYVNAHYNLGVTYNMMGNKEEALRSCENAVKYDPYCTHAYNIMGIIYWSMGKREDAVTAYTKALMTSPSNILAMNNLAGAYFQMGKRDQALEYEQKAIALNPDHPDAYANLGYMYNEMGKNEEAVAYIKKAISLKPGDPNLYNNLGKVFYDMGKKEDALAAVRKALEIDPNQPNAVNNLNVITADLERAKSAGTVSIPK
ncbi:MAG TPA: tetratricopeptide repeat protein [Candidatus Omnitrophota bacterium]|nr:tetratricopeptide repeat protein [Candidatus Omnitrophota bacterium]HPS20634.1 tetratricopeptide repeat protein [Candidatus Omnitrophota bacterium]